MELTDLSLLSQEQLLKVINAATALLDYELYPHTHLYINAKTAEPMYVDEKDAWTKETPVLSNVDPLRDMHWWDASK